MCKGADAPLPSSELKGVFVAEYQETRLSPGWAVREVPKRRMFFDLLF